MTGVQRSIVFCSLATGLMAIVTFAALPAPPDASGNGSTAEVVQFNPKAETTHEWCQTDARWALKAPQGLRGDSCPTWGICDTPTERDAWIPNAATPIITLKIKFNVFANDDGSDVAASQSAIDAQVQQLNRDFLPYGIRFVANSEFINDSTYRQFSDSEETAMKNTYADNPAEQLNVYVVEILGSYGGVGTFSWDPDVLGNQGGIIVSDGRFGGGQKIMTHEVGHCLGLWHTHHGVSEVSTCSVCWERADGLDGDTTGDFAVDTAPTPVNYDCAFADGIDTCSGVVWGETDPQNYMGYASDFCLTEFSWQQAGRMRCWINDRLTGWIGEPHGACCIAQECSIQNASDCENQSGTYQGDNTACEAAAGNPTVYAASVSLAIPDNGGPGNPVTHTINVPDSFPLGDVDVDVELTHTWVGDLTVTVSHNGTTTTVINCPGTGAIGYGCSADNMDVILDDEGMGGPIENQCTNNLSSPPSYTPNNSLSNFDGMDAAGDWTITVYDNAGGSTGTLNAWGLHLDRPGLGPCDSCNVVLYDVDNDGVDDRCDNCNLFNPNQADCNNDGVGNVCEFADGSADCNNNSIPDECESQTDCNANGSLDFCDLFVGASEDCNANGMPDECEPQDDCNGNGIFDACESQDDCNQNDTIDICEWLAWAEQEKLTASNAVPENYFGGAVSISGNIAVVGASDNCAAGDNCGAVYVFHFDGTNWIEEQKLTASDAAPEDYFGNAVSISENIAVVGAWGNDCIAGSNCGAAYVFRFNGANWIEEQKLTAYDAAAEDKFGRDVSVNQDTIVVGAHGDDCPAGSNCGAAYVFRFNGTSWVQEQKLTTLDAADRYFGRSVSIGRDTTVVGAYGDNCGPGNFYCGAAYVFRFNGNSWIEEQKLIASDAAEYDFWGFSTAISENTVLIGAFQQDNCTAGDNCGAAYVFRFDGNSWIEEQKLTAPDAAAEDFFGWSVSISGNKAVVGAWGDDCAGDDNCGSAYAFYFNGTSWVEKQKWTASDAGMRNNFGLSVSVDGHAAIVGSPQSGSTAVENCGAIYAFRVNCDSLDDPGDSGGSTGNLGIKKYRSSLRIP